MSDRAGLNQSRNRMRCILLLLARTCSFQLTDRNLILHPYSDHAPCIKADQGKDEMQLSVLKGLVKKFLLCMI